MCVANNGKGREIEKEAWKGKAVGTVLQKKRPPNDGRDGRTYGE